MEKLEAVNKILAIMGTKTTVSKEAGGWYCSWADWRGNSVKKRYTARRGLPTWGDRWGHGGTCQFVLNQLMRWLQGKTVYPLRVWRHWVSSSVKLGTPDIIDILLAAGYPKHPPCILCGQPLNGSVVWFNTPQGEGPGHFGQCPKLEQAPPPDPPGRGGRVKIFEMCVIIREKSNKRRVGPHGPTPFICYPPLARRSNFG